MEQWQVTVESLEGLVGYAPRCMAKMVIELASGKELVSY